MFASVFYVTIYEVIGCTYALGRGIYLCTNKTNIYIDPVLIVVINSTER